MKAIIAGGDGFIGWPLSIALSHAGFEVLILDNHTRRSLVNEVGSDSLVPIMTLQERLRVWRIVSPASQEVDGEELDIANDVGELHEIIARFAPDVVVHL